MSNKKTEEVLVNEDKVCGHVNKQHHGVDGKLEELVCVLPFGHEGDHSTKYLCLRQVDDNFETARLREQGVKFYTVQGKLYKETEEDAFWSDAAGVLAENVKPDLEQLKALKAKRNAALLEA